jgi:hypothetical protein
MIENDSYQKETKAFRAAQLNVNHRPLRIEPSDPPSG